jgi:DNA-3-methyladenine glycosylase II
MRTMVDHPGWETHGQMCRRLMSDDDGGRWLITVDGRQAKNERLKGGKSLGEPAIVAFPIVGTGAANDVPEFWRGLDDLSPVARFANLSLWDALATAIVRQVVMAQTATRAYRTIGATFGESVAVDGTTVVVMPRPEVVLSLTDEQFADLRMTFWTPALRAAAEAFCKHGDTWRELSPEQLVEALLTVDRVGPWTAGAAVADWSNDFSKYPYGDKAVRVWAGRIAPSHRWPETEPAFEQEWRRLAGHHLSELTMLTLAWGKHHGGHTS